MATNVPALSRGLRLLEVIAATGPLGFSELLSRCRFPKASVARLLAVLRDQGYLHQDDPRGGYSLGSRCRLLTPDVEPAERMRMLAAPHLARVAADCANSALLLQVDGARMRCLATELVEDSVVLQPPGDWRTDLGLGPWGSIIIAELDPAGRRAARAAMHDPSYHDAVFAADLAQLHDTGYVLHQGGPKPGARRLGVPLRDRHGALIAVLGIGGTPWSLPDADIPACAQRLRAAAAAIADELST